MFTLNDYAIKYDQNPDNNFAIACYEQNTLEELRDAVSSMPDQADIATWGLASTQEWRDAIAAAFAAQLQDALAAL